jgi:membrane protein
VATVPFARRSLRAVFLLAQGFAGEAITLRASALTYLTLFALVPALAVIFTVVEVASGAGPVHQGIQRFINEQLGVGAGTAFAGTLGDFVAKAHASAIGGIGFAALLVSVISLLWNIESAFNHIYGVRRPRKALERLLKYWTFLTLGPILLLASVATTWKITALSGQHGHNEQHSEVLHALAALSSVAITYAGLTILYKVLPNARVRFRAALSAALVAGSAWELAKLIFAYASTRMVQVHKIYGSLAALPIILTWIYISWMIALVGCRLCYALEASRKPEPDKALRAAAARETFVARALVELVRLHVERARPVPLGKLAHSLGVTTKLAREALSALAAAGIVVEARQGGFLPSRDPSLITLAQARTAARATLRYPAHRLDEVGNALATSWQRADEQAGAALGETVAQLLARAEEAERRTREEGVAGGGLALPQPAQQRSRP